jgi:serine/threonine-protein phosphatase 2A activator
MRKLQLAYMLEPAGSHGVWGLDDYCILPFLFGAAQLSASPGETELLPPDAIHNAALREELHPEYLYLECIRFIHKVKKGPFGEHSPMLNDISHSVPTWAQVAKGMVRMYKAEVLGKLPVIQHFLFGAILPPP